jgi:hypothetical protein
MEMRVAMAVTEVPGAAIMTMEVIVIGPEAEVLQVVVHAEVLAA